MSWNVYRQGQLAIIWLVSLIAPLAYNNTTLRSFDMAKALIIKSMAPIILLIWLAGIIIYKKWSLLSKLQFLPLIFILVAFFASLSTAFSTDSWISFYGVYERQMGLQALLASLAIGLTLATLIEKTPELKITLYSIVASATLVGLHGVLSHWGADPLNLMRPTPDYLTGLMGHHNFLGNYLAMTLMITIGLLYWEKEKISALIMLSASLIVQSISLYLSMTRGAYIAFIGSLVIIGSFSLLKRIQAGKKKYTLSSSLVLITMMIFSLMGLVVVRIDRILLASSYGFAIAILLFYALKVLQKKVPFKSRKFIIYFSAIYMGTLTLCYVGHHYTQANQSKNIFQRSLNRYYSIFTLSDKASPRFQLWKESLAFLKRAPAFGIGLETFRREFMAHKSSYLESLERHTNYDNPHNSYLYYLASLGLLGSLPYFTLHILILGYFLAFLKNHHKPIDKNILIFVGFFSAYWISSIPGFDVVSTLFLFWVMTGCFASYLYLHEHNLLKDQYQKYKRISKNTPLALSISVMIIFMTLSFGAIESYRYFKADQYMKATRFWQRKKNLNRALHYIHQARKLNPKEHYYIKTQGEILYSIARIQKDKRKTLDFVIKAEKVLNQGLQHSWAPENLYIAKINGRVMLQDYQGAIRACDLALKYSPHLQQIKVLRQRLQSKIQKRN